MFFFDIAYVINESYSYEEIDIIAKIGCLSEKQQSAAGIDYREGKIMDTNGISLPIKVFGDNSDTIHEGIFKFTYLKVINSTYEKLLHTTFNTKIEEVDDAKLQLLNMNPIMKNNVYQGSIIRVDMNSLKPIHLCNSCNNPVSMLGTFYECSNEKCSIFFFLCRSMLVVPRYSLTNLTP